MTGSAVSTILALFLIYLASTVESCGGGGGNRGSGSGWGFQNGGYGYRFENGVEVTGTGSISPPGAGVGVKIPFGRKRRNTDQQGSDYGEDGTSGKSNS